MLWGFMGGYLWAIFGHMTSTKYKYVALERFHCSDADVTKVPKQQAHSTIAVFSIYGIRLWLTVYIIRVTLWCHCSKVLYTSMLLSSYSHHSSVLQLVCYATKTIDQHQHQYRQNNCWWLFLVNVRTVCIILNEIQHISTKIGPI